MKAPILGLAIATVAFGGSSVYLWQQLDQERTRAAAVEKQAAELGARLAQLEQQRPSFAGRHMTGSNGFIAGQFGNADPAGAPPPPPPAGEDPKSGKADEQAVWTTLHRPDRSPAFQKMMRSQIRANNKRMYADVGTRLGLDKETTNKLIDLLTDQQVPDFNAPRDFNDPADWQRFQEEKQRQKLIDVYVQERQRVPMPEGYEGMDAEAYQKSVSAWQEDYNKRTAEEAARILNSEQLTAFNEIQQWQKEMRESMPALPAGAVPRMRRGMVGGNAVMFSTAAPVAVGATANVVVSTPAPEQKKP